MNSFGDRISRMQAEKGIKDSDLVNRIGISRQAIIKWKTGETKNVKFDNLLKLSRVFGISVDELVSGTGVKVSGMQAEISNLELTVLSIFRDMSEAQQREWILAGVEIKRS